ncbi:tRNA (adenosine(37)-N6)-dimethylallyltransferase MiaA [Ornithobacterium rhinotracheale]|uniref:tRNA (adenosine(37)-N6)-dimethylallyltransferase MiaA n=2 Tax=Ornithobacterium rhinotracheale TaxID=28251 RepID=UPI0004F823E9|nr:tRNA (adenosine(37)-N6)-dimethylallyltransferase MiaA [Ornithobacterium rhinotracheale]AIP98828.1 tRNA delta(2)-isopentenylpyrophosphate transferase [Ornithobacterium rhinotracheale ORT-UMN 88]KGB66799.1 tRNA delta(2)-isopentenylpyrophosphate transferase [Ornithobacterium rhinotracheale H06-030791]MCK0195057.1 tRNA (adenosine(37)-N6)-dimethylallyltransferase MiaA [Ornithobacterium rhinotracheale]MCK0200603.1 tRNA (adenosine(37)-N6)-dimethylallyltransferase MiaA [Ornithobacterium rhinotrachea
MNSKNLVVIVGPTAIGKTATAIALAKHFNTEIISSDSRQFFKEMCIGTAVPSPDELSQVKHHFIQQLNIHEDYSVGDFERDAIEFITEYFQKNDFLIMAGGSGLYEKAITQGLDDFPDIPPSVREQLNSDLNEKGLDFLQNELKNKDLAYFEKVDTQNPHRVIRALEVIRHTGKAYSGFLAKNQSKRNFNIIKIGLTLSREEIYDRINRRVDIMIENGLLEEAKNLYKFKNLNALNTVGYKELFHYFDGEISLDFAIEEIKKNTRRFAKRQLTWYRKDENIRWFAPNEIEQIIAYINSEIQ